MDSKHTNKIPFSILSQKEHEKSFNTEFLNYSMFNLSRNILKTKYGFPASKRLAHIHKRSIKFGYKLNEQGTGEICACCLKGVETEPLPTCTSTLPSNLKHQENTHQFKVMASVAMFFLFIKMVILYLLLRIIILDLFNLITNLNEGTSKEETWIYMSLLNKSNNQEMQNLNRIFSLVLVCFSIVYFVSFRKIQYFIYDQIDISYQTADDYAIFVEGIPVLNINQPAINPQNVKLQYDSRLQKLFMYKVLDWLEDSDNWEHLKKGTIQYDYIQQIGEDPEAPPKDIVKAISLCYDISELNRINELRQEMMDQHEYLIEKDRDDPMNLNYHKQIELLNNIELQRTKQITNSHDFGYEITHFVGSAFISFKYQHYRDKILQLYQENKYAFEFQSAYLKISQASHPSEVKWDNLSVSNSERSYRKVVSIFILTITLILAFALILSLNLLEAFNSLFKDVAGVINIVTVILVMGINFGLKQIIYRLVQWERHKTKSDAKFSLIIKLLVTQFINTSLMYYIVSIFKSTNPKSWLTPSGLIPQISTYFVTSGIIAIVLNLANFPIILRKFNLWRWYKDTPDSILEYQVNLNKKFEYPEFDVAQRYTYYLVQLYTAAFYAYLVPLGILVLFITFAIQYWIDKFNLFHQSSLFYELDFRLTRKILKFFETSILVFAAGSLLFSIKINNTAPLLTVLGFIIAALYVILISFSTKTFQNRLFSSFEKLQKYDYDQNIESGKMNLTYWKSNPVTMFVQEKTKSRRFNNRGLMSVYENIETAQ